VSFSVFYAVMLHTLKGLHAFDTSAAFAANKKSLLRFALSVAFLNLLPFLHFSVILLYLLHYLQLNIFSILTIFALSISIFGFDKVFHAILVRFSGRLYTAAEFESVMKFSNDMKRKFASHYLQFLVPGLLYILIPLGLLLLEFEKVSGIATIIGSAAGAVIVWHRWRAMSLRKQDEAASPQDGSQAKGTQRSED